MTLPGSRLPSGRRSGCAAYLGAGGISATSGTNDPRPIASVTKLITAMVILAAHPLAGPGDPGPTITFSEADSDLYDEYYVLGATIVAMPAGSSMPLHDALSVMLIPSASNYADAVATWAFGSEGAFLRAAREWLAANGLSATTIVEPTGVSRRNTSTPSDLMTLARLAAANPVIAAITGTPSVTLGNTGTLYTTNDLLGSHGITGLKTGNLGEGTYNLLYTASLDVGLEAPLSVTGTLLGGSTREAVDGAVVALLDSIRAGFHDVPLAEAGTQVGAYTTPWGETARIVTAEDAAIFTWSDTPVTVAIDTRHPAVYDDGAHVGTITWTAGPRTETVDIEIEGEIEQPSAWWRLTHPGELG